MDLYQVMLRHFSPKDSEEGILTYLVANSDEEVYEWLKHDPELGDGRWLIAPYKYAEEEAGDEKFEIYDAEYNVIGTETYRERIIRLRGDMFDIDADIHDAYYGVTLTGWELVKENITSEEIKTIKDCGISIEAAGG